MNFVEMVDEQQFCLRWNNFQANFTSQFEALRDDEDFTDVTIACEGQRLQAHKVVLSACSPFFKELFKTNPCSHPIIFMRDVEARHIVALLEFMYAGEVNVAQTHLSAFLKTAESLQIRGLTDTDHKNDHMAYINPESSKQSNKHKIKEQIASSSAVTSSQDVAQTSPPKKQCKSEDKDAEVQNDTKNIDSKTEPLDEYLSDEDKDENLLPSFYPLGDITELPGGMEIIPQLTAFTSAKDIVQDASCVPGGDTMRVKLHSLDPRPCEECGRVYSNLSNLRQHMKLIHFPTYVQCPICNKPFKTDLYLRRHLSSSHDGFTRAGLHQQKHFKTTNSIKYELRTAS